MLQKTSFSPLVGSEDPSDLLDFGFDGLIRTTLNTSFLMAVLYRRSKTLPDEIGHSLDPDVVAYAKSCSAWDVPGGGYFRKPYNSWLNRLGPEKRWMFFVHSAVYAVNGLDRSGAVKDSVKFQYDRARPGRNDPRYQHILDDNLFSLKQLFSKISDKHERCAINVRQDLLHNLINLQMAQSRVISPYLGEAEGFVQPILLSDAVAYGMRLTDDLHRLEVRDWLPNAVLKATEQYAQGDKARDEWRDDLYFDL